MMWRVMVVGPCPVEAGMQNPIKFILGKEKPDLRIIIWPLGSDQKGKTLNSADLVFHWNWSIEVRDHFACAAIHYNWGVSLFN